MSIESLYKEEVKELTEFLRNDWDDMRDLLEQHGINVANAFLFGYVEEEDDGTEIGVIYTQDIGFQQFKKKSQILKIETAIVERLKNEFPQVAVFEDLATYSSW